MENKQEIFDFVAERLSKRTGVPTADFSLETNLQGIGVRSIDAILVCGQIEDQFEIEVDPMLMFECSTMQEVVDALSQLITPQ